jgi:outer membrane receptor protein involved in Fe transport
MVAKVEPEISIWGKNLTNTQYNVAALVNGATTIFWRSDEPRTYGVTLSVRY